MLSLSKHIKDNVRIYNAQNTINTLKNNLKQYINENDFKPAPPAIGFYTDDNIANIYASFDISRNSSNPCFVTSDDKGREILYFFANNGANGAISYLRRAYRPTDTQPWNYYNEIVSPYYLASDERIDYLYGVGNDWMIQRIYNPTTNPTSQFWLVKTYGSNNTNMWVKYKNINSIYEETAMGSIYFSEYNTLCYISRSGQRINYKLIDIDTLTDVIPKTILIDNIDDLIDYTGWDTPKTSVGQRGQGPCACVFNEQDNQLIVYSGLNYITGYVNGNPNSFYRALFFPFKASVRTFFKDGIGTLTFMMTPKTDYRHFSTSGGMRSANSDSLWLSYDKYKEKIHTVYTGQGQLNSTIRGVPITNRPQNHEYVFSGQIGNTTYLAPPDATPYAKAVGSPCYIRNGVIYFQGKSDKYGVVQVGSEYNISNLRNVQYFDLIPKTQWIENKEGSSSRGININTAIIRANDTDIRYIYYDRTNLIEITHQNFTGTDGNSKKGKHIETLLTNSKPICPTQYAYFGQCYDIVRNRAYFIVRDVASEDPNKQGFAFLLYWDGTSFIEYRDVPRWTAYCQASKNSFQTYVSFYQHSNFFIDIDGLVYITCSYRTQGSGTGGKETIVINVDSETPIKNYSYVMDNYSHTDDMKIGYDSDRGYFTCGGQYSSANGNIYEVRFSKSFNSAEPERTKDQFFSGNFYKAYLDLASSIGLVAYLQPTQIFLGGYYSITQSEEIFLQPNCDNYIYLTRESKDKIKVEILDYKRTNAFHSVLISKITTNDDIVISQEDYPI